MQIEINLPKWVEGIEDEAILTLVWFLRLLDRKYAEEDEWLVYNISDLNVILGSMLMLETVLDKWQISKWIQVGKPFTGKVMVKIEKTRERDAFKYTITDPRQVFVIAYLKGCLNRNLLEPDDAQPTTAFDRQLRDALAFRDSL